MLASFDADDRGADAVGVVPGAVPHPRRGGAAARPARVARAGDRARRRRRLRREDAGRTARRCCWRGWPGGSRRPREVGGHPERGHDHHQPRARHRCARASWRSTPRGASSALRARIASPLGASLMNAAAGLAVEPRALPARRLRGAELRHRGDAARSPPRRRWPPTAAPGGPRRASSSSA